MPAGIDYKMLRALMQQKHDRERPSMIDLERGTGLTKSTYFRILRGEGVPDAETIAKLCSWLNIPVGLLDSQKESLRMVDGDKSTLENIHLILLQDKSLTEGAVGAPLKIMEIGYMLGTR